MLIKNEKKLVSIVKKKDFSSLWAEGKRIRRPCFFVIYKKNGFSYNRFAFFFPRWTGKAVQRNRFKRWARHFVRKRSWPVGLDILLGFEKTEKDFYNNVNYKQFYSGFEKACQNIEFWKRVDPVWVFLNWGIRVDFWEDLKKQNIYMIYLSSFCLFLIKVYRVFFSIHFGGACRFYPSCSCYAERVFSTHPPVRAIYLVLKRLSKCQFFGPFGIMDPELFPGSESLVGLVEKNKVISRKRDDEGSLKGLKKER